MDAITLAIIILFVLTGNISWYWLKYDLNKRGYKAYIFRGHFMDIANAFSVIGKTKSPKTKKTYKLIVALIILSVVGMISTFILYLEVFQDKNLT